MELTQLKRFILVGTLLNMHRAAEKAHVSQSALSLDLKKLEDELGFLLFERVGKRLILAPRGKRFLEKVRPLIGELEEAKEWASRALEKEGERVVVVAGYTTIHFLLPQLAKFLSVHPEIDLRLITGRDEETLNLLETGEADFALGRYNSLPAYVEAFPFFSVWRVLIINKSGPLKVRRRPNLEEVARLPLCTPGPLSRSYRELVSIFANEGLTPHVVFRTYSNESVLWAVRHNPNWAGIVSVHALTEDDGQRFEIYDLSHLFPSWKVLLLRRKTTLSDKAREQVYSFLKTIHGPQLDKKGRVVLRAKM